MSEEDSRESSRMKTEEMDEAQLFEFYSQIAEKIKMRGDRLADFVSGHVEKELLRREQVKERQSRLDMERKQMEERMALEEKKLEHAKWELQEKLKANPNYQEHAKSSYKPTLPKLPLFKEGKDDIDAFLFRFENHARAAGWVQSQWAACVATLLEGSALSTYHCLAASGALDYETLKKNLLVKFRCTAEGFRERFRAARPVSEEGFSAFEIKLRHLLDRWLDLSETQKTFDAVSERMLCEQFLNSVSKDLATSLGERLDVSTAKLKDLVEASDRYRLAHPDKNLARTPETTVLGSVGVGDRHKESFNLRGFSQNRGFHRGHGEGRGFPTGQQGRQENSRQAQTSNQNVPNKKHYIPFSGECHNCKQKGHKAKDCWSRKSTGWSPQGQLRGQSNSGQFGSSALSLLSASGSILPVVQGSVNGKPAKILRDTGATCAGVKRALVQPDQFTGQEQRVTLFEGAEDVFPLASVWVDSPFYTGQLLCVVIDNPFADIILGNVDGVIPSVAQMMDMVQKAGSLRRQRGETANVLTRAQTKRGMPDTGRFIRRGPRLRPQGPRIPIADAMGMGRFPDGQTVPAAARQQRRMEAEDRRQRETKARDITARHAIEYEEKSMRIEKNLGLHADLSKASVDNERLRREAAARQEQDHANILNLQSQLKDFRQQFEETTEAHKREVKNLNANIRDVARQQDAALRELAELKTQLKLVEETRDVIRRDLIEVNRLVTDDKQRMNVLEEQKAGVVKEAGELRANLREVEKARLDARRELRELRHQVKMLEKLTKERQQMEYKLAAAEARIQEQSGSHKQKTARLESDLAARQAALDAAQREAKQSSEMDQEMADYEGTVMTLNNQVATKETDIQRLEERNKALQEQADGVEEQATVKTEMEALQQGAREKKLKSLETARQEADDAGSERQAEKQKLEKRVAQLEVGGVSPAASASSNSVPVKVKDAKAGVDDDDEFDLFRDEADEEESRGARDATSMKRLESLEKEYRSLNKTQDDLKKLVEEVRRRRRRR